MSAPPEVVATHHVHFDTASLKDDFESENFVTYQRNDDGGITVNLGFLQINHQYAIDLKLPTEYFKEFTRTSKTNSFVPDVSSDVPNLNCHVIDFSGKPNTPDGFYEMKIDFFAYKEKLLKETIKIVNAENKEEILKLVITARVLGKGKGTPMLRNGIHCKGTVKDDDESEASDFTNSEK